MITSEESNGELDDVPTHHQLKRYLNVNKLQILPKKLSNDTRMRCFQADINQSHINSVGYGRAHQNRTNVLP